MKKLLLVLLVVTLASFLLVGCFGTGTTPPPPAEGEVEGVVVDVGAVTIDGKDYVSGGAHDINVTFPAPVANAFVWVSDCTGDYSKSLTSTGTTVGLWPNADKTVWSGSVYFSCTPCIAGECVEYSECCASFIMVEAGECEGDTCISYPVIVDCLPPEVDLSVRFVDCGDPCDPCAESKAVSMEFTSLLETDPCADPTDCCADDCSGIASWTMTVDYSLCAEPCDTISGETCPVEGVSDCCLYYATEDEGEVCYTIAFDIVDKVDNAIEQEKWIVCLDTDEVISFDGVDVVWDPDDLETDWIGVEITGNCFSED